MLRVVSKLNTEAAIWARVIHPDGELNPATARAILRLEFTADEKARMRVLSAKARAGSLNPSESAEIDNYERVGTLLSILKSKARRRLKQAKGNAA